jgi:hypothetical protein
MLRLPRKHEQSRGRCGDHEQSCSRHDPETRRETRTRVSEHAERQRRQRSDDVANSELHTRDRRNLAGASLGQDKSVI